MKCRPRESSALDRVNRPMNLSGGFGHGPLEAFGGFMIHGTQQMQATQNKVIEMLCGQQLPRSLNGLQALPDMSRTPPRRDLGRPQSLLSLDDSVSMCSSPSRDALVPRSPSTDAMVPGAPSTDTIVPRVPSAVVDCEMSDMELTPSKVDNPHALLLAVEKHTAPRLRPCFAGQETARRSPRCDCIDEPLRNEVGSRRRRQWRWGRASRACR